MITMTELAIVTRDRTRSGPRSMAGDYAELADESDPDGAVNICRADGRVAMVLARSVYDSLTRASERRPSVPYTDTPPRRAPAIRVVQEKPLRAALWRLGFSLGASRATMPRWLRHPSAQRGWGEARRRLGCAAEREGASGDRAHDSDGGYAKITSREIGEAPAKVARS